MLPGPNAGRFDRKGRHLRRFGHFAFQVSAVLLLGFAVARLGAQDDADRVVFGGLQLGGAVSTIPFPCNHPVVCEAPSETIWMRIWHGDGLIRRVDVVYSGAALDQPETIRSSPIMLSQAIRSHSIRYGRKAPRLGYAGNQAGLRVIVDTANAIAYFAESVYPESLVKEARYLPVNDPLMARAALSPLTGQGRWLVDAAWTAPRYKNLLVPELESDGVAQ